MGGSIGYCGRDEIERCRSLDCKPKEHPDAAGAPPAGAIFADTLTGLNEVDQQLLLFCSKGQLAAVRWLLRFGADPRARDCNGTTGLHAACRKGSLRVVQAFLDLPGTDRPLPANVSDTCGWTPLHVAACNGRQAVAAALLRSNADATARNKAGQTALELCADSATKSLLLRRGQEDVKVGSGSVSALHIPDMAEMPPPREIQGDPDGDSIRYEPFFVPRDPVIPPGARDHDFLALCDRIAQRCFNAQAGRTLAFLVASGTVRDRPTSIVDYWRMHRLSAEKMGLYLSEDFSLAKILRMEFLNSIRFVDTGVMAALCFAFSEISLPRDLQCLDRITWSLAEVWVRQHLRAQKDAQLRDALQFSSRRELAGPALWNQLLGVEILHELFFSTIMLHWNHYAALPASERVALTDWVEMHRAGDRQIVPPTVLAPIYEMVSQWRWEPLQIEKSPSPDAKSSDDQKTLLDGVACLESWAYTIGDDLLTHVSETAQGIIEQERIHKALGYVCEGTFSARVPVGQSALAAPISHAVKAVSAEDDPVEDPILGMKFSSDVWISLCGPLLFLSFDQVTCPFAFMYVGEVQLSDINPGRALFSLEASPRVDETSRLELVLLLPDGRWHVCSLQKLVLQLTDASYLKDWIASFADLALKRGAGGFGVNPLKHI